MSEMTTQLDHAQDEAMPLVEWALTLMGYCNAEDEYANVIASTNHLEILCFVTGPPLARLPEPTKSCSDFCTRQSAQCIFSGPWRGRAGTAGCPLGGGMWKALWPGLWTEWKPSLGFRGPNSRQTGLTERACRSPTRLTDASANSRAGFNESTLRLEDWNGTNRVSTVGKSQGGTVRGRGGFVLLAPRKNWVTAISLPTDRPAIGAWEAAMAAA